MRIGIFGKNIHSEFIASLNNIFTALKCRRNAIALYQPFAEYLKTKYDIDPGIDAYYNTSEELKNTTDLLFSIGGDGTFLEAASLVGESRIPIVGINIGRLGFLADISQGEIGYAIEQILDGHYRLEERSLLELVKPNNLFLQYNYALNEITFHKIDSSSMITIHAYINDEYLNTYWADGLIISTPTGSTAYSLSVNGPIVSPDSSVFVLSPIASHNLTVRPIVIPDGNELSFEIEGRSEHFLTSLDSRSMITDVQTRIKIRKAGFKLRIIKLREHDFYSTLRGKLMWGVDKRN